MRRWSCWRCRADELHIAIPDAALLIAGLDSMTCPIISQHPEVLFRVQTFRHQNSVDHVPTQDKAVSLGQMLQAELQILDNAGPTKRQKLARVLDAADGSGDPSGGKAAGKGDGGKGKGSGKRQGKDNRGGDNAGEVKACYHWLSKNGCRLGRDCKFHHDKAALTAAVDVANRCFVIRG